MKTSRLSGSLFFASEQCLAKLLPGHPSTIRISLSGLTGQSGTVSGFPDQAGDDRLKVFHFLIADAVILAFQLPPLENAFSFSFRRVAAY
jgi:hypothetical protein